MTERQREGEREAGTERREVGKGARVQIVFSKIPRLLDKTLNTTGLIWPGSNLPGSSCGFGCHTELHNSPVCRYIAAAALACAVL